ncbi:MULTISPECIES: ShlB/FhaC/HecB family hemolysin secretion/activation protein [Agrobacterium]|uniref:ShlB/FhaC/HecB family hemolysin secretion/activation protein n=1 Tax=Agrobacterium TaxID=357 RepID=UPI001573987F|nr:MULTISPECIES: ShlB/FhaC/HecB family hemolysin secretion/activation protein [Agrobacterium]MCW8280060.1 ShlB/FhaC/HecB family hemolysin secretion/activation protein [Agrobacterium sp. InxBP2]NTE48175.1 ShlB/FhaC/HecB family hemolysin secretion/activation protein [Agrobacterium pusense]
MGGIAATNFISNAGLPNMLLAAFIPGFRWLLPPDFYLAVAPANQIFATSAVAVRAERNASVKSTDAFKRTFAISLFASLIASGQASAQSPADDFSRRQEQQEQLQRLENLKQVTPGGVTSRVDRAPGGEAKSNGPCFNISRVEIEGATRLSAAEFRKITQGYDNRCIGVADITTLLKAITDLYLDKGFVTSRAYVPPQDIAGTELLRLVVVEGTILNIYLNGHPVARNGSFATAFPGVKGEVANIRDIEQGLDQINRLSSNDAKTSMLPGKEDGTSILNVENKPRKRWYASISNNNLGQESTGYSQTNVSVGLDDLLGINDQLGFSYGRSGPDYPWDDDSRGHSNSYSVNTSVPYGYWTFSTNGSWYEYESTIPGNFGPIETSGNSGQVGFGIDRVILRDKDSITTLRGGLTYKQTDNFLLGNRIEVGSRRYTIGSLGLSRSQRILGGVIALDFSLDKGLDLFDAVEAGEPGAGTADPRFLKFTTTVTATRPFEAAGQRFELTTLLNAQYSPDNMFGAEQIGLGGYSNVRGLRESVIFGNNGFFSRNELVWRTMPWEGTSLAPVLGELRPYLGLDYGRVFLQHRFDIPEGYLASWTVGAKLVGGNISADFGYSQAFSSSVSGGRGNLIFASVTARW